ncbi:MAG: hypothetical protein IJ087_04660 [Eggerthellaceae bacterium]|nr:hypothetical protein [Eggerthellaceae bacterium]
MRSLKPDSEYFAFLDELRDGGTVNTVLAATYLVREFPGLRAEEAKAVCADWRATYHERRTRPTVARNRQEG